MRHRIFPGMSHNWAVAALPTALESKPDTKTLAGRTQSSASAPALGPGASNDESLCRYGLAGSQTAIGPIPRFDQE